MLEATLSAEDPDAQSDQSEGDSSAHHDNHRERAKKFLHRLVGNFVEMLRSPRARIAGFVIGAVAFGFFVGAAVQRWEDAAPIFADLSWLGAASAFGGFVWFQVFAILSLAAVGANAPARIWAAAQLIKYLPVPGASAAGMLGSSVRYGHSPRHAVGLLVRHTVVLIGTALAIGSLALVDALLTGGGVLRTGALVLLVVAGLGLAAAAVQGPAVTRILATAAGVCAWAGLVAALHFGFPPSLSPSLAAASAYALAWIVGLLVLPVPAGLGVREGMLLLLLAPVTGTEAAIAFALLTRVLHALADGVLVVAFTPGTRLRQTRSENSRTA